MTVFYQVLTLVGIAFLIFILYRQIKGRPDMFTGEKFAKTLTTLGVLALGLIVFVAFLVMTLRH
jgi:hypothetical protein